MNLTRTKIKSQLNKSPPQKKPTLKQIATKPYRYFMRYTTPESKVHGANMGPNWGRQDLGGPHIGPMTFAIWDGFGFWCSAWMFVTRCSLAAPYGVSQFRNQPSVRPGTIMWTAANLLKIGNIGIKFNAISIKLQVFSENLKMSSAKYRPFYLGLQVILSCFYCLWISKGFHDTCHE